MRFSVLLSLLTLIPAALFAAEDLPRGQIVESVQCLADAAQSYALYLPSNYTPARRWSVILGLDAGGRGRNPVVQFQEAAEKYGYIVAGSKNSRNGPLDVSIAAANAVWTDVSKRFSVNPKRLYLAGQSGGARAAMYLATHADAFPIAPAGVIAASAFFPGDDRLSTLNFPVFGTAGTEDFNHLEMKQFDQQLESTHRLAIFEGGHMWLSIPLATKAIEWMELQAMKSGLSARDEALIGSLFDRRVKEAEALPKGLEAWRADAAIAADFSGLRDVQAWAERARQLSEDPAVLAARDDDVEIDEDEDRLSGILQDLLDQLRFPARRARSFAQLRARAMQLHANAIAPDDSPDRQLARRVLSRFSASAGRSKDADLAALLEEIRPASGQVLKVIGVRASPDTPKSR